ncbi:molybdenum cofactor guanylyltransferase [Flavobacterium columnare NBRC 100251 = ATCC 23463]|uniref:Probable molybdenum cofactor guanylyltransferase n=2 Tax=Flavobacterium columnare TaxID=996 RepID=G8XAY5_FLACA|nr:molybdenum cofactor guanylyltransferase [Flavobacterium columnare]AEW85257.1 molybdopterin-guanine dinucleotide biosynthesis protein A-like protein [Flavobacterium columnare ATCC 49512]ANO48963.1 molybdopterin-guanine dinucleotide biosynthesis protein A-like protein [Flavobacterium columnare]APT23029.1 molybdenum cofactor guanylyltransferase [Flavobacterium columnare]AUX17549.1 hypothetical protein AQ623_04110 [Flavobacterium columnare]MBF6652614.1 molybdenum cofactor guanylyltransferase [F
MNITGYILAGGKSSRMGVEKGLLLLNNIPFIKCIKDALDPICNTIQVITSNLEYKRMGFYTIEDLIKEKGPVGGIYTALSCSKTPYTIIVSVDTPLITTELMEILIKNHIDKSSSITIFGNEQSDNPLIGIYNTDLKIVFKEAIVSNTLQLRKVLKNIKTRRIAIPEGFQYQLQNINTKEEYKIIVNQFTDKNAN